MIGSMLPLLLALLLHQAPLAPVPAPRSTGQVEVQPMPDAEYARLVEQLDAADWRAREDATMALARANLEVPSERIERSLGDGGLSLEQVMRLLRVMEIRLLHAPRGALGIQMPINPIVAPGDLVRTAGVRVSAVIPGLPAEQVLQPGDLITHINEQPLANREDLARIVQRHWPGDVLALRVVRDTAVPGPDGEPGGTEQLEVEITLGSTADLRRSGGAQSVLDPALADRRQRLAQLYQRHGAVPSSIPAPLDPERLEMQSEQDHMIRGIMQQIEAVRDGRYTLTMVELRAQMIQKLTSLDATLLERDLPAAQRTLLEYRRVRLQELIDSTDPRERW